MLSGISGLGSEYQIHLNHQQDGRDIMRIKAERGTDSAASDDAHLGEKVSAEIRRKILVRTQVEIVPYGSLPRTERKSRRVFDNRQ